MVYRGKPSAGCSNCRKAKKRCGLEQPACARCVKLGKECTGYRDTTQLQIQDESQSVILKATRNKIQQATAQWVAENPAIVNQIAYDEAHETKASSPGTPSSDSSSSNEGTIDLPPNDHDSSALHEAMDGLSFLGPSFGAVTPATLTFNLKPTADDIATNYFFNQFTSIGHWDFMRNYAKKSRMDPCLDLAIRACGMAALDNVESAVMGKNYARAMYAEALGMLNAALRDPKRCRTDEALVAVAMLGYYENLTCDSRESIQSWKAHILGATQLLKIRGKEQFKTEVGRLLFRETRAQILVNAIWDDYEPPSFLWDWQPDLEAESTLYKMLTTRADIFTRICYDFALLRAGMKDGSLTAAAAADECFNIDTRMIQWSIDTTASSEWWHYTSIDVPDSPHVWNGTVHSYSGNPSPGIWNTWRGIRVLVSRTQELLCSRLPFSPSEREEQRAYYRKVRRQMADDICATVPSLLGHAAPAFNSTCILISAYGAIWPIFFATTCTLERMGSSTWEAVNGMSPNGTQTSAASAQTAWLLGRLEYISETVGLKWAAGIAAVLKGDYRIHSADTLLPENINSPTWLQRIEASHRVKVLVEADNEENQITDNHQPIWLGRAIGENPRVDIN